MPELYTLKSITHSGRKGIRGTPVTDTKYWGMVGSVCNLDTSRLEQFKRFEFDIKSNMYDWFMTSEVLAAKASENELEIETANSIYLFERYNKNGGKN